ncbi:MULTISPECIES: DUF4365 domain-containing protein [Enterobacter]|uniref:DUF4365 domain-containing protein n=1 Tax=Enterobacter pseudoroggenkampii TaxID=2996112 RepID=A0ABT3XH56_9ENTR|nr:MULTISPECIES: DUF4365 domain-containing protein [Enterobacter]MCX8305113.1 DUF4365 domain-containing protein [Enterobacter pseudoroggenkampii]MEA5206676.1 DUF4365 domain-containing protein [Enterobacter mori]
MDKFKQMEQFNIAYVHALASHAGFKISRCDVDDDSVDITIEGTGFTDGKIRNPKIDLQLKSTSNFDVKDGKISYALKKKNYMDLIGDNVLSPRYLVLLQLPEDVSEWLLNSERGVSLHNCCYWCSLRDYEPTENTSSVTIKMPVTQVLTSSFLKDMMKAASNRESV